MADGQEEDLRPSFRFPRPPEDRRLHTQGERLHALRLEPSLPISYLRIMIALDRITQESGLMNGQPCLRNLRMTVRRVVEVAALYLDRSERLVEFPEIEDEDIRQALHYAALHLPDEIVQLPPDALVA